MIKTLTEQWKNRTLPLNHYYVERKNGSVFIDNTVVCFDEGIPFSRLHWKEGIEEVLAPVPTYNQFVKLTEKANQFSQMVKKVNKLEKQLKEANEVIKNMKLCMDDKYDYDCVAEDVDIYLEKWSVK